MTTVEMKFLREEPNTSADRSGDLEELTRGYPATHRYTEKRKSGKI